MAESKQYQNTPAVLHLKQFSPDYFKEKKNRKKVNPRKCRVYYYEKKTPINLEPKYIEEICGSSNFFSIAFEKYLMRKVDNNLMDQTLEKIIKDKDFVNLNDKEKESIRILILSYRARTMAQRQRDRYRVNQVKEMSQELFNKSIESLFYGVQQDQLGSDKDSLKKFQQQQVYLLTKYPQLLESYFWTLMVNQTEVPFIITDNPILTNSHISVIKKFIYHLHVPIVGYPEGFFMPLNFN